MAWRVGPPWFRRMLATAGALVPFLASLVFLSPSTPDIVVYVVWAVSGLLGVYLFSLFGVRPMT
jgi:multidrug transporter EmrE-like cation transporter